MYTMISFKANGERIESVNERPAFYGLVYDGVVIVEYFGTIEALKYAVERLTVDAISNADTVSFRIAA